MGNRAKILIVLLLALSGAAGLERSLAQDILDENPEFKQLFLKMPEKDRAAALKYLSSLSPEERRKLMARAVEMERNRITVEDVYLKHLPPSDPRRPLAFIPLPPGQRPPLTEEEFRQLRDMKLSGVLRVVGFGTAGSGPKARFILVMHKQVPSRVEFALPTEGTLIIVQTDNGWLLQPSEYQKSQKTIGIEPNHEGRNSTMVDFDMGGGRGGSEAFAWSSPP